MQLLLSGRCDTIQVYADVQNLGTVFQFTFELHGRAGDIIVPLLGHRTCEEGLWSSRCLHGFVGLGRARYLQLDSSPQGECSAYLFSDYRSGRQKIDKPPAHVESVDGRSVATAQLGADARRGLALGLAASLEHQSGTWSYWALAHVRSNRPDFHSRDCFIAQLP